MKSPFKFLHKISLIGFLLSILFCFPLLHSYRNFPLIPILDIFDGISPIVDSGVLLILLSSLIISIFVNKQKILTPIILLSYFILILFDVNRFHPEFYFFALTLIILYLHNLKKVSERDSFLMLKILVSAIYIFTGLHKVSDAFVPNVYTPMIEPLRNIFSKPIFKLITSLYWLIPFLEVFIGVGLWIPGFRKWIWKVSLGLHASVLVLLMIHKFNYSVYPWNISMVIFAFVLCKQEYEKNILQRIKESMWIKLTLFQLVLVPISHFFHIAGSSVSFDVYSGKYGYTYVYVPAIMYSNLPEYLKKNCRRIDQEHEDYKLYIDVWAQKELHASIYYEDWALKKYIKYFSKYSEGKEVKIITFKYNEEKLIK